ncbi:uncharacterized protein LOC123531324 [Mercenaria mercenaria]|uniref:uncharacterized protein LOC123531324 n=1 Tax=Mercenaria mercenaria TaxID=6596 RepID=UPI00234F936E|nr:uncharacterized protein LOC123531324 [Mercenaria mercenaria]
MKGRHWETYASEHIEEEFPRRLADVIRTEETEEAIIYNRTPVNISQKNTESLRMGAVHKKTLAPPNRKTAQKSSDVTRSRYIPQIPSKTQHLMRKTLKHLRKDDSVLREDELLATFWDFGGQFIYYATHQIFHSRDAIYLLVFDLTKNLEDVIIDYDFPDRKEKMKNSLLFWANSIEAFAGNNEDHKPTIILVGTHRDEFTGDLDQKFEEVICLFSDTTVKNHIYEKWFAIAAMDMDDIQIDALRETIFKIGKESAGKRKLPAKWIPLENAILEVSHKDILKFQNIIELDETNDFPIRDENEIKDFLKYHHGKGTLVYFDEVGLKDFVVINPQFLINAFRCISTPKLFCRWNFTLEPELKKVTKSAILGKELLTSIWSNAKIRNCKHHKDTLLLFLERHRILAEMLKMDEATGKVFPLGKYLIPIMLKTPSVYSKKVINLFLDGKQCSKIILGLEFKSDVILSTVYEKVTAACLGKWPPIEYKGERLVFKNICFYEIDPSHAGMVVVKDKAIELTGIYLCSKTEDDGTACDYFRRYIEMVISEEFQKFYESKSDDQYNKYLRCNHSEHNGIGSRGVRYIEPLKNCGTVSCPDFSNHSFEFRTAMKEWFLEQNLSKMHVSLMRRLTEQDLNKIAQAIGDNWQLLGISLGLTSNELQHVKYDTQNEGLATSIFYMLNKWKQKYPEKDNVQILKNVMEESSEAVSINWDKIRNILDFDIHK